MEDDSIDMEDDSIGMGYLDTLLAPPHRCGDGGKHVRLGVQYSNVILVVGCEVHRGVAPQVEFESKV